MRPVEVRLRNLPTIVTTGAYAVEAGSWSLDTRDDFEPLEAWENAKAWAAYAHWLETR